MTEKESPKYIKTYFEPRIVLCKINREKSCFLTQFFVVHSFLFIWREAGDSNPPNPLS